MSFRLTLVLNQKNQIEVYELFFLLLVLTESQKLADTKTLRFNYFSKVSFKSSTSVAKERCGIICGISEERWS